MRCWVWGGSSGIGAATAAHLTAADHEVLVLSRHRPPGALDWHRFDCDRSVEDVQRHVRWLIWATGKGFEGEERDWYVEEGLPPRRMRERWGLERRGAPDLAILSAGMGAYMLWNQWRDQWWDDGKKHAGVENVLRVNATSKAAIAKELLLAMRRRRSGRVLVVGSAMAGRGDHGAEIYAMAQAALRGFVLSAHRHAGRRGVTLALAEPGWVDTPMTAVLPEWKRRAAEREFGQFLTAEYVAGQMLEHDYRPGEVFPIERSG
jgi:NAD(P)-dependent dehydrogenase (short-subunit alcohol dehydrogenase family)